MPPIEPSDAEVESFVERNSAPPVIEPSSTFEPSDAEVEAFVEGKRFNDPLAAGTLGAARTLSFGLSDVALTQSGLFSPEELSKYKENNPTASAVGEFGALGLSLIPTAGLGLLSTGARTATTGLRAARGAGNIVERAIAKKFTEKVGSSAAKDVLKAAASVGAGSAVEGAFYGAGQVVSEYALGNPDLTAQNALTTIGLSGLLSGAAGSTFNVLGQGMKALATNAKPWSKKAFAAIRGVDEETIDLVANRADEIASIEALGNDTDEALGVWTQKKAQGYADKRSAFIDTSVSEVNRIIDDAQLNGHKLPFMTLRRAIQKAKADIAPDGVEVTTDVQSALKRLDSLERNLDELATGNASKIATEEVIESYLKHIPRTTGKSARFVKTVKDKAGMGAQRDLSVEAMADGRSALEMGDDALGRVMDDEGASFVRSLQRELGIPLDDRLKGIPILQDLTQGNRFIPVDIIGKQVKEADKFITPRQMNFIRKQLNDASQAAYTPTFKATPLADAFASVADESRALLDTVSTDIRKINARLKEGIEIQKRLGSFGLKEEIPEVKKLRRLLTATNRARSDHAADIKRLDELLGTNFADDQLLGRAVLDLNPKNAFFKVPTGASLFLPTISAITGFTVNPALGAAGAVGAAALQAPVLTKPIIKGAKALDQLGVGKTALSAKNVASAAIPEELAPFVAAQVAALSMIERQNQRVDRRIRNGVSTIMRGETTKESRFPRNQALFNFKAAKGSGTAETRIKNYRRILDQVSERLVNPIALQEQVAENLKQLSLVAPETAASLQNRAIQGVQYLYDKAPKSPEDTPLSFGSLKQDYVPSDIELDSFEATVRALDDPLSVLDDISTNSLRNESVEALKVFYPDLYAQILNEIVLTNQKRKGPLEYAKRLQMAILFDLPTEAALRPDIFQVLQGSYQVADQSELSGTERQQLNKLPSVQTPTQRVSAR